MIELANEHTVKRTGLKHPLPKGDGKNGPAERLGMVFMEKIKKGDSSVLIRMKIMEFQSQLEGMLDKMNLPELPEHRLVHSFADGAYVREITIPAGQLIIGRIHKHSHVNYISRGRVTCVTESKGVEELVGPCTMISPAGTKRVLFTHEETVWTTVHVTNATTVEDAERDAVTDDYEELVMPIPMAQLAPGASALRGGVR